LVAFLAWPLGLVLILAYSLGELVPPAVFLPIDAALAVAYVVVLRRLGVARDPAIAALAGAGVGLFVLVGVVGPPTAAEPLAMLLNAVALLGVAVALLGAAVSLARRLGSGPAVLAAVALAVGSVGYLLNLLARWAVVVAGAAPAQAVVEDRAWTASSYLRGLDGEPSYLTFLLVWFDLIQVAYIVLAYLAFAGLAVALRRDGRLTARVTRFTTTAGWTMAGLVVVGAAVAPLDGPLGTVGAWTAFVLTIPFMSTLLPHVLGVALAPAGSGVDPQPVRTAFALDVR
jgi:hypothetical protein